VTATFGSHARAEAVSAFAFQDAGLKCSFHSNVPNKYKLAITYRRWALLWFPARKKVGYSIEMWPLIQSQGRYFYRLYRSEAQFRSMPGADRVNASYDGPCRDCPTCFQKDINRLYTYIVIQWSLVLRRLKYNHKQVNLLI